MLLYVFTAEDNNTRVLFEKAVSSVPSDKARLASYYYIVHALHDFFTCIASLHMYLHVYTGHTCTNNNAIHVCTCTSVAYPGSEEGRC